MKVSWIFLVNDVLVNIGVIIVGILVVMMGLYILDLVVGVIIGFIVLNGVWRIFLL